MGSAVPPIVRLGDRPQPLGPYRLIARVGDGRRSVVFAGRMGDSGPPLAIRILRNATDRGRFDAQLQRAGSLLLGGLPAQAIEVEGRSTYCDPLIVAEPLNRLPHLAADHGQASALPLDVAVNIGLGIIDALAAANRIRLHGDLLARHVLVGFDGRVHLRDPCGDYPIDNDPSRSGYRSPERLNGEGPSVRDDVFALGALLFELTTGQPLFEGPRRAHLDEVPRPRDVAGEDYPLELQLILRRMLRPTASARYESAVAARAELLQVAQRLGRVGASAVSTWMQSCAYDRLATWRALLAKPTDHAPPRAHMAAGHSAMAMPGTAAEQKRAAAHQRAAEHELDAEHGLDAEQAKTAVSRPSIEDAEIATNVQAIELDLSGQTLQTDINMMSELKALRIPAPVEREPLTSVAPMEHETQRSLNALTQADLISPSEDGEVMPTAVEAEREAATQVAPDPLRQTKESLRQTTERRRNTETMHPDDAATSLDAIEDVRFDAIPPVTAVPPDMITNVENRPDAMTDPGDVLDNDDRGQFAPLNSNHAVRESWSSQDIELTLDSASSWNQQEQPDWISADATWPSEEAASLPTDPERRLPKPITDTFDEASAPALLDSQDLAVIHNAFEIVPSEAEVPPSNTRTAPLGPSVITEPPPLVAGKAKQADIVTHVVRERLTVADEAEIAPVAWDANVSEEESERTHEEWPSGDTNPPQTLRSESYIPPASVNTKISISDIKEPSLVVPVVEGPNSRRPNKGFPWSMFGLGVVTAAVVGAIVVMSVRLWMASSLTLPAPIEDDQAAAMDLSPIPMPDTAAEGLLPEEDKVQAASRIRLKVLPAHATVRVDGRIVSNEVTLEIRKATVIDADATGYRRQTQTVHPGQQSPVLLLLKRERPPAESPP